MRQAFALLWFSQRILLTWATNICVIVMPQIPGTLGHHASRFASRWCADRPGSQLAPDWSLSSCSFTVKYSKQSTAHISHQQAWVQSSLWCSWPQTAFIPLKGHIKEVEFLFSLRVESTLIHSRSALYQKKNLIQCSFLRSRGVAHGVLRSGKDNVYSQVKEVEYLYHMDSLLTDTLNPRLNLGWVSSSHLSIKIVELRWS